VLTVGDWLAHWLVSRTAPAASTVRGYTAHVRLYLAPYLGQVLLAELSAAHVQAMFTAKQVVSLVLTAGKVGGRSERARTTPAAYMPGGHRAEPRRRGCLQAAAGAPAAGG
jgi:hypothetical protein